MGWTLLYYMLEAFKWLILIRAVLSWFVSPYSRHPLVVLLRRVTDPVLRPVAQALPDLGGLDISPIVVFLLIQLLQSLVWRASFL